MAQMVAIVAAWTGLSTPVLVEPNVCTLFLYTFVPKALGFVQLTFGAQSAMHSYFT